MVEWHGYGRAYPRDRGLRLSRVQSIFGGTTEIMKAIITVSGRRWLGVGT